MTAYMLKVRTGKDTYVKPDGTIGTAGKGGLVSEELSFTLAATQDQTLIHDNGGEYVVRRITPMEAERLMGFPDGWTDITGCDVDGTTDIVAASLVYDEKQKAALRRKVARWSKGCPDAPRYKCCGNSMATNVMLWIGDRIQMVRDILDERGASSERLSF